MLKTLNLDEKAVWRQRFRSSSILWAKIANLNPKRGLVCTDVDGTSQLFAWEVATGNLRQLTNMPAGVVSGIISADGEYIIFLRDIGGSETGHYVRIPFAGGLEEDLTPTLPPYSSYEINQSFSGNILGFRAGGPDGLGLYVFTPGSPPRLIYTSHSSFLGPSFSFDGSIVAIASTEGMHSLDTRLLALDSQTGEQIAELWDGENISHKLGVFAPLPGDFRILTGTTKSSYNRPMIWDVETQARRELNIDGINGDVEAWQWSPAANRVLLSQLHQARRKLHLYDLAEDSVKQLKHPSGLVGSYFDTGIFTEEDEIIITWQDPSSPTRLIALDSRGNKEQRTILAAGEAFVGHPWQPVNFTSDNGDQIHAWLAVPDGQGPFPTIIHVKGGPTSVMLEYYYPESQAWLDHGFAFFSINYHGATTFGKPFEKSIVGRLGELEIQDISAGFHWLVERGISRRDEVFITGVSYGGYLTLQAMGKLPDLWSGGMAGVAIADWALLYEDENDSMRGYQRALFGGTPEELPGAYAKSSPITYAEQIQAPILVIQGINDSRCPARQMRAYEDKLRSFGKQIDVHWFEAGHGSRAQEQRIAHQELQLRFVYEILGG